MKLNRIAFSLFAVASLSHGAAGQVATQPNSAPAETQPAGVPIVVPTSTVSPDAPTASAPLMPSTNLSATAPSTQPASAMRAPSTGSTSQPSSFTTSRDSFRGFRRDDSRTASRLTVPAAKPMPRDFMLLSARSIFIHSPYGQGVGPDIVRVDGPTTGPTLPIANPSERNFVFDGATKVENDIVAFVEDLSMNKVMSLKAGDSVASGKVTSVTLDTLTYSANGRDTRVSPGYTLDNYPAPTSQPGGALFGSAGGSPFGQPGGNSFGSRYDSGSGRGDRGDRSSRYGQSNGGNGGYNNGGNGNSGNSGSTSAPPSSSGGGTSNANVNDILERLKAKRAAELGGK